MGPWHEFVLNNRLERSFVEEMWIPIITETSIYVDERGTYAATAEGIVHVGYSGRWRRVTREIVSSVHLKYSSLEIGYCDHCDQYRIDAGGGKNA